MSPRLAIAMAMKQSREIDDYVRLTEYQKAWDSYYGRVDKPLKVEKGQTDDNIVVTFAQFIVDKGVSFLFGKKIQFEIDLPVEGDSTDLTKKREKTPAEIWLEKAWKKNKQGALLQKVGVMGGVCGQVFVKVNDTKPYPRLSLIDPAYVTVYYSPDDIDDIYKYIICYPAIDGDDRAITVEQTIERENTEDNTSFWVITDLKRDTALGMIIEGPNVIDWPYEISPIQTTQNLPAVNFWGISDIEETLLNTNKAINFVLSNMSRILKYHAHPKTWGKGFNADQIQIAVDETLVIESLDGSLANLEMQGDLSSSLEFYRELKKILHEVSRVPEIATGRIEGMGDISGVALQVMYQTLIEKTESKRELYGDLLANLSQIMLLLGGHGEQEVSIVWPKLLPVDALLERQALAIEVGLGTSKDTILTELGRDPESERKKRELDAKEAIKQAQDMAATTGIQPGLAGKTDNKPGVNPKDKEDIEQEK